MNTNVVPITKDQYVDYSSEELSLIKTQIAPGASDAELKLFIAVSKNLGLNPLKRQIYAIQRSVKVGNVFQQRMTIQVSVDGLLAIAERSNQFAGVTAPQFCGDDAVWRDVWLAGIPAAAKIGVMRRGWREPVWGVAVMSEYAQDNAMWKTKPTHMLEKCALAKALRRAFPNEFSEVSETTDVRADGEYGDPDTGEVYEARAYTDEDAPTAAAEAQDAPVPPPPVQDTTEPWKLAADACWTKVWEWAREHGTDANRIRYYLATSSGVPEKANSAAFKRWLDEVGPDFDALYVLYVDGERNAAAEPVQGSLE